MYDGSDDFEDDDDEGSFSLHSQFYVGFFRTSKFMLIVPLRFNFIFTHKAGDV